SGLAAGIPGVYQLTFQVPADVSGGNQKVIFKIGTRVTADGPQLAIAAGAPSAPIVANGATFQARDTLHPLAPNTFVSIFASNIGTSDTAQSIFPAAQYQGTSVLFNGKAVPLYFVFPTLGQINLVTPADLGESGNGTVSIINGQGASQVLTVALQPADVGIFR